MLKTLLMARKAGCSVRFRILLPPTQTHVPRAGVARTTEEKQAGQERLGAGDNTAIYVQQSSNAGMDSPSINQGRPTCLVLERALVLFLSERRRRTTRTHSTRTRVRDSTGRRWARRKPCLPQASGRAGGQQHACRRSAPAGGTYGEGVRAHSLGRPVETPSWRPRGQAPSSARR